MLNTPIDMNAKTTTAPVLPKAASKMKERGWTLSLTAAKSFLKSQERLVVHPVADRKHVPHSQGQNDHDQGTCNGTNADCQDDCPRNSCRSVGGLS